MPKLGDLQAKSTKLKEKYNALLPEHNAFVTKRDTAHKYTWQMRNCLQNKEQQERNRQYQEKKAHSTEKERHTWITAGSLPNGIPPQSRRDGYGESCTPETTNAPWAFIVRNVCIMKKASANSALATLRRT